MQNNFQILENRSLISVCGDDNKAFLQGLITNDINKIDQNQMIYSLMLSPSGRFLYDFFITKKDEKILLDCNKNKAVEIVNKLSFYKLRSKVEIQAESDLLVAITFNQHQFNDKKAIIFEDPRNNNMGFRSIISKECLLNDSEENSIDQNKIDFVDQYNISRILLKLPDDSDLTFDQSFPLEFGFDNFNAVDYQKGCYVGQENTARTHYKGTIRKKIFLVEVLNTKKIAKNSEIISYEKKIGTILSSIFYQNKLLALALIKNVDNENLEINLESLKLTTESNLTIKLIK